MSPRRSAKIREELKVAAKAPVTLDDIKFALKECKGNYAKAANMLDMQRTALHRKVISTPSLNRYRQQIIDEKLDNIEEKLLDQAEDGLMPAINLVLRTLGKERGYSEKTTTEHELGEGLRNAASLIAVMRRSAEERKLIARGEESEDMIVDVGEYEWEEKDSE